MAQEQRKKIASKPGLLDHIRSYLRDHARSLLFSLGKLYRQPVAAILTITMIAVALALPTGLLVLLDNLQTVAAGWHKIGEINVFLKNSLDDNEIKKLKKQIEQMPQVHAVRYISSAEALREFKQQGQLGVIAEGLDENPLPPVFVIQPWHDNWSDPQITKLEESLKALPDIALVQADTLWLQRFHAILQIVSRLVTVIAVLLGITVLLVIGNTIRLDIENRRHEIEVTKLIGGTNGFIRRPFLYGGIWYGLFGGILALLILLIAYAVLNPYVQRLVTLYESDFEVIGLSIKASMILLVTSISLGLLGSWLAVGRQLARIEPK